jgi:hypothetical protein
MRIEIQSDGNGSRLVCHLGEDESRGLNSGLEHEARQWRAELRRRLEGSPDLEALRRLQASLASSKSELQASKAQEGDLLAERRKILESGQAAGNVERKLTQVATTQSIVSGRVAELETIIRSRIALAAARVREEFDQVQGELYLATQREKNDLETAFLQQAGLIISQLVRLSRLSASRGHDQQRLLRQLAEQDRGRQIIEELLAAPSETPEPAAAATATAT